MSGLGVPSAILETLDEGPLPTAILVITNFFDSAGALKRYDGPSRAREIIERAHAKGVGVMGVRAVQPGALTDSFDRPVPEDHPDMADYHRAAPFRILARELGESAASLAHRYAPSMEGVSTVILGVKNRAELRGCIAAEEKGPLDSAIVFCLDSIAGIK